MAQSTVSFASYAQTYARAMSSNHVYVTFGGSDAYTNGSRINLPALPADVTMTPWEVRVMNGFLDHEISHIRYTDWVAWRSIKGNTLRGLSNILEDIRIENLLIKEFPGTKDGLDACTQELENRKRKEGETPSNLAQSLMEAIYISVYRDYRDVENVSFAFDIDLGGFPGGKEIADLLKELSYLKDTAGAISLAERILQKLPKNMTQPTSPPEIDPSTGEPLPVILGGGTGGEPYNGPIIVVGYSNLSSQEKAAFDEAVSSVEENLKSESLGDFSKDLQSQDGFKEVEWRGQKILPPCGTQKDRIYVPSKEDLDMYERVRSGASGEIAQMKRMLQIYLQSRNTKAWEKGLDEGLIDEDNLAGFAAGDHRLFKQRREKRLMNTAVEVMVDLSGSMTESTTRLAAVMLSEAISAVPQVKLSVTGFTTNNHRYNGSGGRCVGLDLPLFKDFDEPHVKARGRLGALSTYGYTPLGEAYAYGHSRIVARKEKRKVLWLITDGSPYFPCNDNSHNEYMLMGRVHERNKARGIESVLTNIGRVQKEASQHTDITRNIKNESNLAQSMLEIIKGIVR